MNALTISAHGGLDRIEVRYYDDPARIEPIAFPEASYEASLGDNPEWATQTLRVGYESMVSPSSVYDYDVPGRTLTLKVDDAELARRRQEFDAHGAPGAAPVPTRGYAALFHRSVLQADEGCDFDFLVPGRGPR